MADSSNANAPVEPAAADVQEAPPAKAPAAPAPGPVESTTVPKSKRRKSTSGAPRVEQHDTLDPTPYVLHTERLLPVNVLRWDTNLSQGQVRLLDPAVVAERKASLLQTPPTVPVQVTVWSTDVLGVSPPPSRCVPYFFRRRPFPDAKGLVGMLDVPLNECPVLTVFIRWGNTTGNSRSRSMSR